MIANNGGDRDRSDRGPAEPDLAQFHLRQRGCRASTSTRHVGQPVPPPVLTFTPGAGSTGTLSGTLTASPNLAYTIEIFSNPIGRPGRPGAGQDVRPGRDGEYRQLGQRHLLGDRTDRLLHGDGDRSVGEYLAVLERRRIDRPWRPRRRRCRRRRTRRPSASR